MNQFNCIAAVVKPYELRTITTKRTNSDRSVMDLRVACDRPGKDTGADFFTVSTFGATADLLNRIAHPGQRLGITGRIELQEWKDDEGNQQQRYRVIADRVDVIDWPDKDDATADAAAQQTAAA